MSSINGPKGPPDTPLTGTSIQGSNPPAESTKREQQHDILERSPPSSPRKTPRTPGPQSGVSSPRAQKTRNLRKAEKPRPQPLGLSEISETLQGLPASSLLRSPTSPRFPRMRKMQAPLFTGVPKFKQARQGTLGNCWLMAPLAAIARTRPEFITDFLCSEVPFDPSTEIAPDLDDRIKQGNHTAIDLSEDDLEFDDLDEDDFDIDSDEEDSDWEDDEVSELEKQRPRRAFKIKLFSGHGTQEELFVDNNLPHQSGKLPFAHPCPGEKAIWAAVIEKAVASNLNRISPTYKSIEKNAGVVGHQTLSGKALSHSRPLQGQPTEVIDELLTRIVGDRNFPTTVTRVKSSSTRQSPHREHELVVHSYKNKRLRLIDQRNGASSYFTLTQLSEGKKSGVRLKLLNWSELPDEPSPQGD